MKYSQRLSRILIGISSMAWYKFNIISSKGSMCRCCLTLQSIVQYLKFFFKFHRRFLQREMPMVPKLSMPVTDVRDVAGAHITAMTSPKAPGKKPTSISVSFLFSSFNFR